MLFVYGPYMPLRWLEEVRFWKTQEKEHTVVIREIAPYLEPQYVRTLREWEPVFAGTGQSADLMLQQWLQNPANLPPSAESQVDALLQASRAQSEAFIRQLAYIRNHSAAVRSNAVAPVVIHQVMRESQYFLQVLDSLGGGRRLGSRQEAYADGQPGGEAMAGQTFPDGQPNIGAAAGRRDVNGRTRSDVANAQPSEVTATIAARADRESGVPIGGHTLPPLPYAYNALEPYIDEKTMRIHHDKHHRSYVDGLNKAEKELDKARRTGNFDLVKHWERELAFNGAGHYLHTIFWRTMTPGGSEPSGPVIDAIQQAFGSFDAFKKQFSQAAEKVEGGGWAILVWSPRSGRVEILQAEKHQNLSQWDVVPLLPLDVWEHAYYLKHQNNRGEYIRDWWNVVNWPYVNERYAAASKLRWEPY